MLVLAPYRYTLGNYRKGDPVPPYRFARRRRHMNARDYRRMLSWQRLQKKSSARRKLARKGR